MIKIEINGQVLTFQEDGIRINGNYISIDDFFSAVGGHVAPKRFDLAKFYKENGITTTLKQDGSSFYRGIGKSTYAKELSDKMGIPIVSSVVTRSKDDTAISFASVVRGDRGIKNRFLIPDELKESNAKDLTSLGYILIGGNILNGK